jgi:hypothetical protein
VVGAIALQKRRCAIAAITSVWLVACGILAMRHQAETRHVRDSRGVEVHASALGGHHDPGQPSDVHGLADPGFEAGDCAILTALHQPGSAAHATISTTTVLNATVAELAPVSARAAVAADMVYRLAPKTSPPVRG